MEKLKIKTIGVLREREEISNGNSGNKMKSSAAPDTGGDGDGGGGGGEGDGVNGGRASATAIVRQLPKMSALDLAGILNCRRRLEWTKEWLKKNQTEFLSKENLRKEIQFRSNEIYHFNSFFDITERQFRYLVGKLSPVISSYEPHRKKKSFSAEERIAITLKYLATGEVHSCRNYCFRASKPVILKMIANICLNIYELLKDQFLSLPKTDEQWQNVANELQRKNRLPNCIGNMTMQQIKFYSSSRAEDETDYVKKQPLIFTSIVDSSNNFIYVNVEKTKAATHDEIYEYSTIKQLIEGNALTLPVHGIIESQATNRNSYYFAGNNVLPLKCYLLNAENGVPNPKNNNGSTAVSWSYGYAMDLMNMHTENALRVLANVFPILSQPLRIDEENGRKITLGCVALYNFLRKTDRAFYKQTEKIHLKDELEDEDCILLGNEEELREREEFTPNVVLTNCFQQLRKQRGDTAAGTAKRDFLIQHLADNKLN